ncbi:50S ribosomal protein L6 [Metamycoplasma arthritidis]|uniref:Large ribosomal subunit protein uL6 n=1 Tax=Metamycoplasma arthritidis (strain 158L3-1) TaxID=243272 RepID=RL6_META1|nr:50S ribosomal protein L6 [Metamycoplasma arthritidis]B3PMN2.1 RecName: Full=Large ribosomal subunit protein uL6; AltName: Full=50S ribosomal protein L6 [Metamycoplasma arthritidis 158L3-1]ACF07284.1 ribosomal protein L6 [Metamycoplasma arthritidis 158L3-1]VEU78806.1 50S ribosomal protein L6 [Metamycoplasma arthritidis]
MSRIGNRILKVPANTEVVIENNHITVKGKLGELHYSFSSLIKVNLENGEITTVRSNEEKTTKQLHGTTNAIIKNMLIGVSEGYKKEIEIKGVGYKATLKGNEIEVIAGYSHPVTLALPSNLKVELPKPTNIIISGIDKQAVGEFAANLRKIRKPSPYSGKGIMYKDEQIRRKEGKTASK